MELRKQQIAKANNVIVPLASQRRVQRELVQIEGPSVFWTHQYPVFTRHQPQNRERDVVWRVALGVREVEQLVGSRQVRRL